MEDKRFGFMGVMADDMVAGLAGFALLDLFKDASHSGRALTLSKTASGS